MARKTASDGRQQIRVGTRDDNRVFKFNSSWSAKDVDRVKQQLKDVYDVCLGWNGLSSSIADNLRKGVSPVPLPDIKLGFELNRKSLKKYDEYVKADQPTNFDRHSKIKQLIDRTTDIPLAMLDINQCRILIDYWRSRPMRHDGKGKYSAKKIERAARRTRFVLSAYSYQQ